MSTRTFALVSGIVFVLVGIAGFIPGLMQMSHPDHPRIIVNQNYGLLFGLFAVNLLHNLVHLLFGVWGLASLRSDGAARIYARGVAIIYGVLTIAGFVPGLETMFGLVPLFQNDIWLHAVIALVAAFFGWIHRDSVVPEGGTPIQ